MYISSNIKHHAYKQALINPRIGKIYKYRQQINLTNK